MTSLPNRQFSESNPRGRISIRQLEVEEQFLRDIGEPAAADKIAAMRQAVAEGWKAHTEAQAAREAARAVGQNPQSDSPREVPARGSLEEARILAPVYDLINEIAERIRAEQAREDHVDAD